MSDQITDRRAKLEKIRALGVDPYGGRFTGVVGNAEIRQRGDTLNLPAGQTSEDPAARVRAAGRVVLYRDIGKLIFLTVRDWSGELQFGISKAMLEKGSGFRVQGSGNVPPAGSHSHVPTLPPAPAVVQSSALPPAVPQSSALPPGEVPPPDGATAWQLAKLLDLGDIIGADGALGRTKTGELTLWVTNLYMLSKALRPPPEKWHGLTDVEARYRRRYVDLAANPESQKIFLTRARIIDYIRRVLARRGFVEVETPVLQPIYGGAAARPFETHHNTLDMKLYLRISPELYLKRCLVGGLERVYEFARCFRNEGISPRHNPEFTMLELYQAYGDYHDMMEITEEIVAGAAREVIGSYQIPYEGKTIDYTPPWPRRRYLDLLRDYADIDVTDSTTILSAWSKFRVGEERISFDSRTGEFIHEGIKLPDAPHMHESLVLSAIFEKVVEPKLINPTFVIDFPAPLCPLTRRHPQDPSLALRFEPYVNGMEMGNAYSELNDPAVQCENFSAAVEGEGDETMRVMDVDFVESLEHGMPPAGGLGIGIDRLTMLLTGSGSIREVILFPVQRILDQARVQVKGAIAALEEGKTGGFPELKDPDES